MVSIFSLLLNHLAMSLIEERYAHFNRIYFAFVPKIENFEIVLINQKSSEPLVKYKLSYINPFRLLKNNV